MKIEKININKLKLSEYNPRKDLQPDDSEYKKIKKSIEEFGYVDPLIVNKDCTVIGGHQRLKVLKELGFSDIDCVVVDLSKSKEKALNIALNKIQGDWDLFKLKNLLSEIDTGEFDIEITGFDENEIEDLMTQFYVPEENEKDDEVPEVPEEPITKLGYLYKLGEHRLLCGDATKIEDVEKLMNGQKADMVFTDPPYGIDLDTDWTKLKRSNKLKQRIGKGVKGHKYKPVIGDDKKFNFKDFNWLDIEEQFWWGADYYCQDLPYNGSWIIWDKRLNENMDKVMGNPFEVLWSKKKHRKEIIRNAWTGAYGFHEDTKTRIHPTQKPIKVCSFVLMKYSNENQIVLDLFGGSGSTLIACEKLNRKCYMMEIDPMYCDVIVKRWEDYTGKKAELVIDDKV